MNGSPWVPFSLLWNDAPIDLSPLYADERPAGRRGFVRAEDGRLVFADGTEARFWGVCLNGGANFPEHHESEIVARRLAKFGVNIVRCHQMDAEFSTPNLFEFNRAFPADTTRSFDPQSMDRLDYLTSCLKAQGIYLYLDMLTYRKFLPGDEVDAPERLGRGAGSYSNFDPRLIELQQEFNANLWTHVNPYTGLAYADDPAIALAELINEKDLFSSPPVTEPYRSRLEAQFRGWASARAIALPAEPIDFAKLDAPMAAYLSELQRDYYRQMIEHLRSLGVKVPIAGTNMHHNLANLEAQVDTDFLDNHVYWNFPWWEEPSGTTTFPMVKETRNAFANGVFHRRLDKPFFLSEWNQCWPDEWRAESPIALAAVAAFQGWSGTAICGYRYNSHVPPARLGGTSPIGGSGTRLHLETFNDPALFGLFYHAALLFRRGDVRTGTTSAAIEIVDDDEGAWRLIYLNEVGEGAWTIEGTSSLAALPLAAERHRVGMSLPGQRIEADVILDPERPIVDPTSGSISSDSDELGRNWDRGYGWIDTPRTKAVYGFVGNAGTIALDGLECTIDTDFATVAISSLTDEPLDRSGAMLLTAVGRCDNTDARYDLTHRWQVDMGHAPVQIEVIEGDVRLRTSRSDLRVWMLTEHGYVLAWMPATCEDGILRFRLGLYQSRSPEPMDWNPQGTIYYLIRP